MTKVFVGLYTISDVVELYITTPVVPIDPVCPLRGLTKNPVVVDDKGLPDALSIILFDD
jgi:hypothetical protein